MAVTDPVEPLLESAHIAWSEAPRLCRRDPRTGETCLWYHKAWQYLRLLGVISTIRTNTGFLLNAFRDCAKAGGFFRVLVSATADYSLLAHLKYAYDQEQKPLDVTVVDRCETPLLLNRWYADRCDIRLGTACADLLEYVAVHPFDLVCTHNLLSRFDVASRRRLVAHWHGLLRPGGVVVTTQRVRPGVGADFSSYTNDQVERLLDRVAAAVESYPVPLDIETTDLVTAVRAYAIRRRRHVIRSNSEVTDLFVSQGFDVELADEGGGHAERDQDRQLVDDGPDTYRMRIVARKR